MNIDQKITELERRIERDPSNLRNIKEYVGLLHRLGRKSTPEYEAIASDKYAFSSDSSLNYPATKTDLVEVASITGMFWDGEEFAFAKVEGNDVFKEKKKRTYWLFKNKWWGKYNSTNPYAYDASCFERLGVPQDAEDAPIWNSDYYLVNGKDMFGNLFRVVINWWTINQILWHEQTAYIVEFAKQHGLQFDPQTEQNLFKMSPEQKIMAFLRMQELEGREAENASPNELTISTLSKLYFLNDNLWSRFSQRSWQEYVVDDYNKYILDVIGSHASITVGMNKKQGQAYGFYDEDNIEMVKKGWGVCHRNLIGHVEESWLGPFKEQAQAETWYQIMLRDELAWDGEQAITYQLGEELKNFHNPLLEFQVLWHFGQREEGYWLYPIDITAVSEKLGKDLTFEPAFGFVQLEGEFETGAAGEIHQG